MGKIIILKNRFVSWLSSLNRIKILIFISALVLTFGTRAFANFDAYLNGEEKVSGLTSLIFNWVDQIAGVETLNSVSQKVAINLDFDAESIDIGGMTLTGVSTGIKQIHSLMVVAATAFAVICFLIALQKKYFQNPYAKELLVKQFLILGISLVLIGKSLWICQQLANFGTGMTTAVINNLSSGGNDDNSAANQLIEIKRTIYEECQKEGKGLKALTVAISNFVTQLNYVLQLLIPWLITYAVSLIVSFTCWSRAVEIIILATLSPIAFADTLSERGGAGEKFVRNYLALALQGVVIIVIMYFCNQINMSILMSEGDFIITKVPKIVIIGLVQVGLITKSLTMTKEVVGLA